MVRFEDGREREVWHAVVRRKWIARLYATRGKTCGAAWREEAIIYGAAWGDATCCGERKSGDAIRRGKLQTMVRSCGTRRKKWRRGFRGRYYNSHRGLRCQNERRGATASTEKNLTPHLGGMRCKGRRGLV